MFPSRRSVMAIRISRESLPPTFSSSCATSYSLHLNFMVLVGPGCDIKTLSDGRVQFERINLRLNKRTASMWATTRDKLLEKTLWSRGQQRIVWLWRRLARVIWWKREQFLKSFRYTRGKFTFYFRRLRSWGRIIRYIFCWKQRGKSRLSNMIYIMTRYTF